MISCKFIPGAAAVLSALTLLSCPAFAQREAGLIGKQYAGLTVFTEDVRSFDTGTGYGTGVAANIPVGPNLDFSLAASYERFGDINLKDKRLSASAVAYQQMGDVKVFVDGTLGGTWQSVDFAGQNVSNNDGIYAAGFGAEAAISPATALFGRIAYNRYFDSKNGDYWTFAVGLNHWVSQKLGLVFSVTAFESDSIVYSGGIVVRF